MSRSATPPQREIHHILTIFVVMLLSGCASTYSATMSLFSSSVPVQAVIHDTVLQGEARLYTDRSGTLELTAPTGSLRCMGAMHHTSSRAGVLELRCSNGGAHQLHFIALTHTSGHGHSPATQETASFTFGLDAEQARGYLKPPPAKHLVREGEHLRLEWD